MFLFIDLTILCHLASGMLGEFVSHAHFSGDKKNRENSLKNPQKYTKMSYFVDFIFELKVIYHSTLNCK